MVSPCVSVPIFTLTPPNHSTAMIARLTTANVRGVRSAEMRAAPILVSAVAVATLSNSVFACFCLENARITRAPERLCAVLREISSRFFCARFYPRHGQA